MGTGVSRYPEPGLELFLDWIGFGLGMGISFVMISIGYFNLHFCVGRTNCEDGFFKRELAGYGWLKGLKQKCNGFFFFLNMIITLVGEIKA